MNSQMDHILATGDGFIAALDQSGGSTPTALRHYGLDESTYGSDAQMFDLVHAMRTRIIASPSFTGERILGAILFEQTMEREIEGRGTAEYLWEVKRIPAFLKVDRGLEPEGAGVRLMKPIDDLEDLLARASAHGVFGTKMRSVVLLAEEAAIRAVVSQQFALARRILAAGLVPIIEPEVDIHSQRKAAAEVLVAAAVTEELDHLDAEHHVMLKLTLPEHDDLYAPLVQHPRVLRVVALSGGYNRTEACARLSRQHGVVASFSRALTEGLTARQGQSDFDATLDAAIEEIYRASLT